MNNISISKIVLLALSSSFLVSTAAYAQIDEIIVTAQKKEQNLQDVPIAITAFDVEALEKFQIDGVEDIGKYSPGVNVTPNPADNNGVRINIRGVGTFDPQMGQDSRIAVYRDGVYLGRTQGLAFSMPDLERVEVLKGPQGTLYGRNTIGGAVNLISATPDTSEFSAKISGQYGSYSFSQVDGAVNLPIGDKAALRLSGMAMGQDGWVENNGPGTDFAGRKAAGFRAALGVEASDKLTLNLAADYSKVQNQPLFYQAINEADSTSIFAAAVSHFDGRQDSVTTSVSPEDGNLEAKGLTFTADYEINENHDMKFTAAYREMDSSRFVILAPTTNPIILQGILAADLDQDPGNGVFSIHSALAAAPTLLGLNTRGDTTVRADYFTQLGGAGAPDLGLFFSPPGGSPTIEGHQQFSIDATFNGSFKDGRLDYTAGLFYFDEESSTGPRRQNFQDANSYLFVLAALGLVGPGLGALGGGDTATATGFANNLHDLYESARQSAANTLSIDTTAWALYSQLTWHATEDLRLIGGLRYSKEEKSGFGQSASPFFLDETTLMGNPIAPNNASFEDDRLDPSLTVEYDLNEAMLLYASYKVAYRAGGFNSAAVGVPVAPATHGADFVFDTEENTAFEVGFKGAFSDSFRFNAAAFHYSLKDKQTTAALNPLIATERAVVNTDETITGFEADAIWAPTEALTFVASFARIDGETDDVVVPVINEVRERDELQGTPKTSFMVGFDYRKPFRDNIDWFVSSNYASTSDRLHIPEDQLRLSERNLVGARLGMEMDTGNGEKLKIALWGENLLDDEYEIDKLPFNTFAKTVLVYGQPRTIGVKFGYEF